MIEKTDNYRYSEKATVPIIEIDTQEAEHVSKKAVEIEDLLELVSVTDPKISPDGKRAVFIETKMDEEENTYHSHVHHISLETGEATQWTYGKSRNSQPAWSADGRHIAFLSDRSGKNQLHVLPASGGEARAVTDFEKGVSSFRWSPCNKKIWINALAQDGKTFADAEPDKEEDKKKPEPYRTTSMKYKMDGNGLVKQDFHRQIGVVDLETEKVEQLTEGPYHSSLEAISRDGKKLVYGSAKQQDQDFVFRQSLYMRNLETGEDTAIIEQDGYYGDAVFSFDDARLAFVGQSRIYENATHTELHVYDTAAQTTQCLTEGIDAPIGDYVVADHQQGAQAPGVVWTKDDHLYFQVSTEGDVRLYFASLDGAVYPASPEDEHVYGYDIAQDGSFALAAISDPVSPGELYKLAISTGERVALTSCNASYLEQTELIAPETVSHMTEDGFGVQGWLMKPKGYEPGSKYPLVVNIHGGPHAMYANTFVHEMQLLAANGYGVLYVNPRGSHGYGQHFVDAVRGDYGGGDYRDILGALDSVIEGNDWVDTERLGVTGGSYGGFMTNWIVSHTDRFKAAVTQRSICNWISFFGVSDIGYYFSEWQHGASMDNVDKLWEHSPLKYAKDIQTPLLILHSENDHRCPIEQGEQLFVTLKSMHKETEFVRFPEVDHNLSRTGKPNLRFARLQEIVGWMERL